MARVISTFRPFVKTNPLFFTPRTLSTPQRVITLSLSSFSKRSYTTPKPVAGVEEAQTLIEREHFAKVRRRLEADTRKKISFQEFVDICGKEGLNKDQAKQLSQSLSDSGSILYFGNSANTVLKDSIFLKPVEFNNTVSRIVAELSDDTYLRSEVARKQEELGKLHAELKPLEETRASLERKASRRAKTIIWAGLGYCVAQAAIVARLTWWELSWDVMEPVTYMLTFATALIGYSFFVLTGSEYTYEGLKHTLERRRLSKLIRRSGFDEAAFQKLKQAVLIREHDVANLLEQIRSDPVTLHLKDPSSPVV